HSWFPGVRPLRFEHDVLVLSVPNSIAAERITSQYLPIVETALLQATGRGLAVELQVDTDARVDGALAPLAAELPKAQPTPGAPTAPPVSDTPWASSTLNPRYTFDQFVIG